MTKYLELEVRLKDILPDVWRRFRISSDATLADLHAALQVLCGWDAGCLYEFRTLGRVLGYGNIGDEHIEPSVAGVRLDDVFRSMGDWCYYLGDYGQVWRQIVKLVGVGESAGGRVLVAGAGAFPPLDSRWSWQTWELAFGWDGDKRRMLAQSARWEIKRFEDWLRWVRWERDGFDLGAAAKAFDLR